MSSLIVEMCEIKEVLPHGNADKLEVVVIKDWTVIVGKDQFKKGDKVLYVPIDAVLTPELEDKLFKDSKIQLTKGRIRATKIRGVVSYGFAIMPSVVGLESEKIGKDVAEDLGITKYEPPVSASPKSNMRMASKKECNPNFFKYTDIENFKNHPEVFQEGEFVEITEKIHGSNFRAGWVKRDINSWWKKTLARIGWISEYQFVFGSHNVQLQNKMLEKTYYDTNIYAEMVKKYSLKSVLRPGEVIYGEVYGDGVQKNYSYGCKAGERKLVVFDVRFNHAYTSPKERSNYCKERGLPEVPVLELGPFNMDRAKTLAEGASILWPEKKVREGVVIKSGQEEICRIGRKVLKLINPAYLLDKENSDEH